MSEEIMLKWDSWRKYIANGGKASWPRDVFESIIEGFEDTVARLTKERDEALALAYPNDMFDPSKREILSWREHYAVAHEQFAEDVKAFHVQIDALTKERDEARGALAQLLAHRSNHAINCAHLALDPTQQEKK